MNNALFNWLGTRTRYRTHANHRCVRCAWRIANRVNQRKSAMLPSQIAFGAYVMAGFQAMQKQMSHMSEHKNVYQIVTERILEALAKGTVPWHKPWKSIGGPNFPMSMSTGKPYRGINLFLLGFAEYSSPWWGTKKIIAKLGGTVREDEPFSIAIFWKSFPVKETDDNGNEVTKMIPMLRYYRVYNADQCDGLPQKYQATITVSGTFAEHREGEKIINEYLNRLHAPRMIFGGDSAYWSPVTDVIRVPPKDAYESPAEYYCTTIHEVAHSTGHCDRLNRTECVKYGDVDENNHAYRPREEMCAEMTAAMLMSIAGIDDPSAFDNSVSYINGWRKHISDDPKLVVLAAAKAQHAADYILGITYENHEESE